MSLTSQEYREDRKHLLDDLNAIKTYIEAEPAGIVTRQQAMEAVDRLLKIEEDYVQSIVVELDRLNKQS